MTKTFVRLPLLALVVASLAACATVPGEPVAHATAAPAADVRRFHAQVLNSGGLPLTVLEAKIDAWIAAGGG